MSAKYTWSEFQQQVIEIIETADRSAPDFFVRSPITIDCRADGEAFRAVANADAIRERHSLKPLLTVNALTGGARIYANAKLREHYDMLDAETRTRTRQFLREWMSEHGRAEHQASKRRDGAYNFDTGIEIALPLDGMRLPYDVSSLSGVI